MTEKSIQEMAEAAVRACEKRRDLMWNRARQQDDTPEGSSLMRRIYDERAIEANVLSVEVAVAMGCKVEYKNIEQIPIESDLDLKERKELQSALQWLVSTVENSTYLDGADADDEDGEVSEIAEALEDMRPLFDRYGVTLSGCNGQDDER